MSLSVQMNPEILDQVPALIVIVDAKGVVRFVNELWKDFASSHGLKGMNFRVGSNYIDVCKNAQENYAKEMQVIGNGLKAILAKRQQTFAVEYPCHTKEQRWIRVIISRVSEGKNLGAVVMYFDITESKNDQKILEKERHFISTILDTADALVVVLDPDWRILRFNRICENLTGRTIEEMRGKSFLDLAVVSGEDGPAVKKLLASFKGQRFPVSFENAWVGRDRRLRWIKWSNTVIMDKRGKTEYIIATGLDITERKKIEQDLSKEREFISAVLDTAGALVIVLDRQGRIVRFNRACEELSGYSFEEVLGKSIWDLLLLPEEIPAVKRVFRDLRQGTFSNQLENHWVTKDKETRRIAWSNAILANEKGEVTHLIGTGIDITERRKAEQEINRLWKHNELILDSAGEGIYGIDVNGKVTFFNHAAEQLTGWTWRKIKGQVSHSLLHHTKLDGTPYLWEECPVYLSLTHGNVQRVDTEVLWHKDGTHFPVAYTSSPIMNDKKKIEGVVVTFKDISERKKAEEALQESEERFQAFMDHSPAVAFLKDTRGRYVYVNRPFEEKLNLTMADCLGKTDQQLFPPEVARIFTEHDQEALKTGEVLETEETTLDKKGDTRFWWVMKFLVHRRTGPLLLGGVALDITSRRNAEEVLRQREVELQRSQEALQALGGQLISAQEDERRRISRELHDDMNQRLAVLAFNIQSTQKELTETAPMYQTLQSLYDGVSMLSDDVRHLAYQLHPSILDDLGLEVALQAFVNDFSKWEGIPVVFTSTDVPVSLAQDIASCLYRVTQECLRNVARHAQATQVEVELLGENGGLKLSIKDNGKGFKIEETRGGKLGLGLIGMEERVRVVQGTYEVKSAPGQGTENTVWVPTREVNREK
jgi:PAS domain S-box-containing protein